MACSRCSGRSPSRSLRIVEVETKEPSPFARSLLFGYVGAFVYEGDVPLAEKKAAALSLDATLLAELLGKDGLKQLLDADVIAGIEADLQGLSTERRVATRSSCSTCCAPPARSPAWSWPHELLLGLTSRRDRQLVGDRRVVEVRIAGQEMLAVAEDVPRLRDGLGIPVPPGVAAAFTESCRTSHRRSGAALGPHPRTVRRLIDRAALRPRPRGRRGGLRRRWSRRAPWSPVPSSTWRARRPANDASTATARCWR